MYTIRTPFLKRFSPSNKPMTEPTCVSGKAQREKNIKKTTAKRWQWEHRHRIQADLLTFASYRVGVHVGAQGDHARDQGGKPAPSNGHNTTDCTDATPVIRKSKPKKRSKRNRSEWITSDPTIGGGGSLPEGGVENHAVGDLRSPKEIGRLEMRRHSETQRIRIWRRVCACAPEPNPLTRCTKTHSLIRNIHVEMAVGKRKEKRCGWSGRREWMRLRKQTFERIHII